MKPLYRIVSWNNGVGRTGRTVVDIREFGPTQTPCGTTRRIGRTILSLLENPDADELVITQTLQQIETGN